MTRDHFRKKAVRAFGAETGRAYLDAATALGQHGGGADGRPLAGELRDALAVALRSAGWPVVIEHHPQLHALPIYAGPATVHVSRAAEPQIAATGDEHPDDPAVFDLAMPLTVTVWAPLTVDYSEALGRVAGVDAHEISAALAPVEIVAELDRVVAQARRRDLAEATVDIACGVCGDRYAAGGLARPVGSPVAVCPCCAFDGDLLGAEPGQLAFDLDMAAARNLAAPAGWAGAQALLCCVGGGELHGWLHQDWRSAGTLYEPGECWVNAGQIWVWLPPIDQRPAALSGLGCGACLDQVLTAVDRAHPDARDRFRAYLAEELDDGFDEDEDDVDRVPDEVVERLWPAVVAYAVALLTQQAERPGHRSPWHVLDSLELDDWLDVLPGDDLDEYWAGMVLRGGIITVRDLLDPVEPGQLRE
ncbi:MAG: hypothetical protein QOF58_5644 [Pseudonocardiales bacterium]|jgi:hypothetical protein|nr:hypothetical protein [Pseudonocardiales bacterium]